MSSVKRTFGAISPNFGKKLEISVCLQFIGPMAGDAPWDADRAKMTL